MNEVFCRVGAPEPLVSGEPAVSVLMPTIRPENVSRIVIENFTKQTYENKELILILNNAEFDHRRRSKLRPSPYPNVQVLQVEGRTTLGDCLNRGADSASGKYVAKMDDDDHYGGMIPIGQRSCCLRYSDAEVVGKGVCFVYFEATDRTALEGEPPRRTRSHRPL